MPRFLSLVATLFIHCAGQSPDPERRLTNGECTESVDHAIALLSAENAESGQARLMREGREHFIAQCVSVATLRDRECLMKAKTAIEMGTCPMPGAQN